MPVHYDKTHDNIYATPHERIPDFTFDENVADVFQDMIQRSAPGYNMIISMIGMLAERYAQSESNCYDLGCSLCAAALSIRNGIKLQKCRIIAVDNSLAMIKHCRKIINADRADTPIDLVCADIRDIKIRNASVVVLNFTLQFIDPGDRLDILTKIHKGMLPGGILILSEKVAFDDQRQQELHISLHHAFKKFKGYSDLEISQKRTSLENVLIPESLEAHRQRILLAGFSSCDLWFQCFNFASMIAVK